ncbi:MAG: hypothetical protein OK438_04365 [Thaumarchaeota archaeon]|nr:hypothetical protein [Nitrososphaerota archaeon]
MSEQSTVSPEEEHLGKASDLIPAWRMQLLKMIAAMDEEKSERADE